MARVEMAAEMKILTWTMTPMRTVRAMNLTKMI